jgi:hypothetical protein
MISTLYSHNSASLPHKKSLPKKDSYINQQFNIKVIFFSIKRQIYQIKLVNKKSLLVTNIFFKVIF